MGMELQYITDECAKLKLSIAPSKIYHATDVPRRTHIFHRWINVGSHNSRYPYYCTTLHQWL